MQGELQQLFHQVEELVNDGRLAEAEQALTELAALARTRQDPLAEGVALGDLASVQAELGSHSAAWQNWPNAAAVLIGLPGGEWELARSVYWPMARHARGCNQAEAAHWAYQQATAVLEQLAPSSEEFSLHLAGLLADWAQWHCEIAQGEQAEALYGRALAALAAFHQPSVRLRDSQARLLDGHADILKNLGRLEESAAQWRSARRIFEEIGCTEGVVASLVSLARALWSGGDVDESRRAASDAAERAEEAAGARPAVRGEAFENQGRFLLAEGRDIEADTYFQLAEILYRRQVEEDDPDQWIVPLQQVVAQRATLLIQRHDLRAAAVTVEELIAFWRPYLDADPERRMPAYLMPVHRLTKLYQALGETEKAGALVAQIRHLRVNLAANRTASLTPA